DASVHARHRESTFGEHDESSRWSSGAKLLRQCAGKWRNGALYMDDVGRDAAQWRDVEFCRHAERDGGAAGNLYVHGAGYRQYEPTADGVAHVDDQDRRAACHHDGDVARWCYG